jgi:hypothetical protein
MILTTFIARFFTAEYSPSSFILGCCPDFNAEYLPGLHCNQIAGTNGANVSKHFISEAKQVGGHPEFGYRPGIPSSNSLICRFWPLLRTIHFLLAIKRTVFLCRVMYLELFIATNALSYRNRKWHRYKIARGVQMRAASRAHGAQGD